MIATLHSPHTPKSQMTLPLKSNNASISEELTLCLVRDIDVEGEAVLGLIGEEGGLLPGQIGGPARLLRQQLGAHRARALSQ